MTDCAKSSKKLGESGYECEIYSIRDIHHPFVTDVCDRHYKYLYRVVGTMEIGIKLLVFRYT